MTGPVNTDDLVQGAVKWLLGQPTVTAVLGTTAEGSPLLFQHSLWVKVEGTQSTAAVISRAGGWAGANPHNTLRFPRLSLELYTDPLRDAGNNVVEPGESWRRIEAAFSAFDKLLHRPAPTTQMWGTVRTVGSLRQTEPVVYPVPDGDGVLRLQAFYGIAQG